MGVKKNFERAILLCDGDAISLCDGDDVWNERKLELTEQLLQSYPSCGLVFTNAEMVDATLRPLGRNVWDIIGFDRRSQ